MAAADVSSLIDLAVGPADPTTPAPDTEEVLDPTTEDSTTPEATETGDGTTEAAAAPPADDRPIDARTNPAAIRSALKAFRDLDPKNAPIARQLNDAYGRYTAYKEVFPKVADAQAARALLDAVGGDEGLTNLQATVKSVNETDALLYAGDKRVLDSLYDDMKAAGKEAAFSKLAGPYLDKLRKISPEAYNETLQPHFFAAIKASGLTGVVNGILDAIKDPAKPNVDAIKSMASDILEWYKNLEQTVGKTAPDELAPEREAFERERSEFQSQKQKDFEISVATSCEEHNNRSLGAALRPYLKSPFFKGFSRESLAVIGSNIKQRLFSELTNDASYQSQMDAFFSAPSPDRAKITSFHQAKVDTMAKRIVKSTIETMYPNYARGAVAPPKKAAPAATAAPTGITFVPAKPADTDIDWSRDPQRMLFITSKAYLKNGKLVSWKPRK